MVLFQGVFNLLKGIFPHANSAQSGRTHTELRPRVQQSQEGSTSGPNGLTNEPVGRCQQRVQQVKKSTKRRASCEMVENSYKRVRTDQNGGYSEVQVSSSPNRKTDREMMPPPATPLDPDRRTQHNGYVKEGMPDLFDTISETKSQRTRTGDVQGDYDMEVARRRAATAQLPENSGVWEPAEEDLFYHLAHRGFEPLLPKNWMVDFRTLPLSLFAVHADQDPLIAHYRSTEFRAIKALQELMDTGKTVRDRAQSSHAQLRTEPVIERAINKYIKWGLKDMGVSSKQCIPVHAVAAMKQGQSARDTIRDLTLKMHNLAARHRHECDMVTSVEQESEARNDHDKTCLRDEELHDEHQLPVIYGIMICSSLIALFTLSSHAPPPSFVTRKQKNKSMARTSHSATETLGDEDSDSDDEDSGLRFIATFDFNDSASDVWNAIAVAITATMIRKTLVEVYDIPATTEEPDFDESVLDSSVIDGDTEVGINRYVARYAVGKLREQEQ